jgi:hypothetical protein
MRTAELFEFIKERHTIYLRRQQGLPKPWTQDTILQKYRFCNVYRELDTVTQWIARNWRGPNTTDPNIWFAMTVARMFNLPSTLEAIGYPVPFKPEKVRKVVKELQANHVTVFSAAYMIRCDCQEPGKTKVDYLVDKVFTPMWKARNKVKLTTLAKLHSDLMPFYGMGSFMAGQVVCDVKFTSRFIPPDPDWWAWAVPGPGSMRGLNRVFEGDPKKPWKGNSWNVALKMLQEEIDPLIAKAKMPRISASDLQNVNCEWDKFERVRLGEGRPKQLYPGV